MMGSKFYIHAVKDKFGGRTKMFWACRLRQLCGHVKRIVKLYIGSGDVIFMGRFPVYIHMRAERNHCNILSSVETLPSSLQTMPTTCKWLNDPTDGQVLL